MLYKFELFKTLPMTVLSLYSVSVMYFSKNKSGKRISKVLNDTIQVTVSIPLEIIHTIIKMPHHLNASFHSPLVYQTNFNPFKNPR